MKKVKMIILAALSVSALTGIQAQTLYDASRLLDNDLNGTARFVGMGGAMGALGGDISTMGTNPAGIGIYRSNDAMISFGFKSLNTESKLGSSTNETDKFRGSFDNLGFVFSNKIGNRTALKYVNFGFNYHKAKSFDKDMVMGGAFSTLKNGEMITMSQVDVFAAMSQGLKFDYLKSDAAFTDGGSDAAPWLGAMALRTRLIGTKEGTNDQYQTNVGFTDDGQGNLVYAPVNGAYRSRERGGVHSYDFNVSFNFYDRIYLGATLGAYSVDYSRYSMYSESYNGDASNYSLENWFDTDGSGVDFKLGLIVRPFETLPLRIGAAVHTPTWFKLEDRASAIITSDVDMNSNGTIDNDELYQYDTMDFPGESVNKYELITPWKYNLSLGYTIGQSVALGAEYEYADYSTAKLKYDNGSDMVFENNGIKDGLKGVSTWRFGAEFKVVPEFAFRLGYNNTSASTYSDTFKNLQANTIRTDTEYANRKAINNYTIGFGYRGEMFYADLAYQYNTYKEDFYAFDNVDLPATKITNSNSQVLMTLGVRF